jgi:LacI family transcriptional regulator
VEALEVTGNDDPEAEILRHLIHQPSKKLIADFENLSTPVAIVCENDHYARLVCQIAKILGRKIPEDFGILGGGDEVIASFGSPTLSSIHLPGQEIGRLAASFIAADNPPERTPVKVTMDHLVVRESTGGSSLDVHMERVRRWIQINRLASPSMAELAEIGECGIKTLRQKYRKLFGIDPLTEARQQRLEEITRLLRDTKLQLADISSKCGFSSQAAFYNYVMRHCGEPPSRIRSHSASTEAH